MFKSVFLAMTVLGLFVVSCGTVGKARINYEEPEWLKMVAAYNETVEEKDKIICEKRTQVDSHIPKWNCTTVAHREKERQNFQLGYAP